MKFFSAATLALLLTGPSLFAGVNYSSVPSATVSSSITKAEFLASGKTFDQVSGELVAKCNSELNTELAKVKDISGTVILQTKLCSVEEYSRTIFERALVTYSSDDSIIRVTGSFTFIR